MYLRLPHVVYVKSLHIVMFEFDVLMKFSLTIFCFVLASFGYHDYNS